MGEQPFFTVEEIEAGEREVLHGKTLPEHIRDMTPDERAQALAAFDGHALAKLLQRVPEDEGLRWRSERTDAIIEGLIH